MTLTFSCFAFIGIAQLYIAQPSLSQQIAALERQIGVKLLIRNRHAVQLTVAGLTFLKEANEILNKSEEAISRVRQAERGTVGNLRIGYLGVVPGHFLPKLLVPFRRKYPRIELALFRLSVGALDQALYKNNLDIGFTVLTDSDEIPPLSWRKIQTDALSWIMASDNPLVNETKFQTASLAQESFVFTARESSGRVFHNLQRVCKNRGFSPCIVNSDQYIESVLLMVEAGVGISVFPRYVADSYASPYLSFVDMQGDDTYVDTAVVWKKTNTNPAIALMVEEIDIQKANAV
ncbi:MAG TPA: LysR family transcriptional regulator [Negativicutes bacterium]|jgi:DNA-binding transcriptional LysR family regulator